MIFYLWPRFGLGRIGYLLFFRWDQSILLAREESQNKETVNDSRGFIVLQSHWLLVTTLVRSRRLDSNSVNKHLIICPLSVFNILKSLFQPECDTLVYKRRTRSRQLVKKIFSKIRFPFYFKESERELKINRGALLVMSFVLFLTRELRACARVSYRYDVGNGIRSLARLVDSCKLF